MHLNFTYNSLNNNKKQELGCNTERAVMKRPFLKVVTILIISTFFITNMGFGELQSTGFREVECMKEKKTRASRAVFDLMKRIAGIGQAELMAARFSELINPIEVNITSAVKRCFNSSLDTMDAAGKAAADELFEQYSEYYENVTHPDAKETLVDPDDLLELYRDDIKELRESHEKGEIEGELSLDGFLIPEESTAAEGELVRFMAGRRASEILLEERLVRGGEGAITKFAKMIESDRNESIGPYAFSEFEGKAPEQDIVSMSISDVAYTLAKKDFPNIAKQERLRVMAQIAIQNALGRRVTIDFGIGNVGVLELAVGASTRSQMPEHKPGKKYRSALKGYAHRSFMIGKDRLLDDTYFKIEDIKRGESPIRADDPDLIPILKKAHARGNMTATFLDEVVATAYFVLLSIPQHPNNIMSGHPEMIFADPDDGLDVLRIVARYLQPHAACLIESTVFPLYIELFATPIFEEELAKRGMPKKRWPALIYSFQRLHPGRRGLETNRTQARVGGATTEKGFKALKEYYEAIGYKYTLVHKVATAEYMKDCENAIRYQIIASTVPLQTICESLGLDIYKMAKGITAERPDRTCGTASLQATFDQGGYCTKEQWGHLVYGLLAAGMATELDIMATSWPVAANIIATDMRAQDVVRWIIAEYAKKGLMPQDLSVVLMGITYNPEIDDSRNGQSEEAACEFADNQVTNITAFDSYATRWPQLQHMQRYSPEAERTHGRTGQEWLRGIRFVSSKDPYDAIRPGQHVVVLATEHPQLLGARQPKEKRTDGSGNVCPGIDAVETTARMLVAGGDGKTIVDTHNFLSEEDKKRFLALGWTVRSLGQGNLHDIEITHAERAAIFKELLERLTAIRDVRTSGGEESPDEINKIIGKVYFRISTLKAHQKISFEFQGGHTEQEVVAELTRTQITPWTTKSAGYYEELASLARALSQQLIQGGLRSDSPKQMRSHLQRLQYLMGAVGRAIEDTRLMARDILDDEGVQALPQNLLEKVPARPRTVRRMTYPQATVRDALIAQILGINASFQDNSVVTGTNFFEIAGNIAEVRPTSHGGLLLQPGFLLDEKLMKAAELLEAKLRASGEYSDLENRALLFGYHANLAKLRERPFVVSQRILIELAELGIPASLVNGVVVSSQVQNEAVRVLQEQLEKFGCSPARFSEQPNLENAITAKTNLVVLTDKDVCEGFDPVGAIRKAKEQGQGDVLVFDADNILSNDQIRELLSLGCRIAATGRGDIYGQDAVDIKGNPRHIAGLDDAVEHEQEPGRGDIAGALSEAQAAAVVPLEQKLAGQYEVLAELAEAMHEQIDAGHAREPKNARDALACMRGLAYMTRSVLDAAVVDAGRAGVELFNEEGTAELRDRKDMMERETRGNRLVLDRILDPKDIDEVENPKIPEIVIQKAKKWIYAGEWFAQLSEEEQAVFNEDSEEVAATKLADTTVTDAQREVIVKHAQELFYDSFTAGGDIRVIPAVKMARGDDGKHIGLEYDPEGNLKILSTRFLMDVAMGKREQYERNPDRVKYHTLVPLKVVKSALALPEDKRKSNYFITELLTNSSLPWRTKEWLIKEVLEKGYILTTVKTEDAQDAIVPETGDRLYVVGHANPYSNLFSPSGIGASGRAGFIVVEHADDKSFELVVTKDEYGREQLVEIKGVGALLGERTPEEVMGMKRLMTGGVTKGKEGKKQKAKQIQVAQLHGLIRDLGGVPFLIMLQDQLDHKVNGNMAGVAGAVFYGFDFIEDPKNPGTAQPLTQIWRTTHMNEREGHITLGGPEDFNEARCKRAARVIGRAMAVMLAGMGSEAYVHIAPGLDNMKDFAFTDEDSLVSIGNARIPKTIFKYYFDWGMRFVLHYYDEPTKLEDITHPHFDFFDDYMDEFLTTLCSMPLIRHNEQAKECLMRYHPDNIGELQWSNPLLAEFTEAVWKQYTAYRAFRSLLELGHDPTGESPYTASNPDKRYTPKGSGAKAAAVEFLNAHEEMLRDAKEVAHEYGFKDGKFDFEYAFDIIRQKRKSALERSDNADFSDVYTLGLYKGRMSFEHSTVDQKATFGIDGRSRISSVVLKRTESEDKAAIRKAMSTNVTTVKTNTAGSRFSETWNRQVEAAFDNKTVGVLGPTGQVALDLMSYIAQHPASEGVKMVKALEYDAPVQDEIRALLADKLERIQGDHRNLKDIREVFDDTDIIIDTAGMVAQGETSQEVLKGHLVHNAAAVAMKGLLLQSDQRYVWTSSSAIDVMLSSLDDEERQMILSHIEAAARSYVDTIGRGLEGGGGSVSQPVVQNNLAAKQIAQLAEAKDTVTIKGVNIIQFVEENSYAFSKLLGQTILQHLAKEKSKDIVVVKISDVYSDRHPIGKALFDQEAYQRRVQFLLSAQYAVQEEGWQPWTLEGEKTRGFYQDPDGVTQKIYADYASVTHGRMVAEAITRAASIKRDQLSERKIILDLTGPPLRNKDMAETIRKVVGQERVQLKFELDESKRRDLPAWNDADWKFLDIDFGAGYQEHLARFETDIRAWCGARFSEVEHVLDGTGEMAYSLSEWRSILTNYETSGAYGWLEANYGSDPDRIKEKAELYLGLLDKFEGLYNPGNAKVYITRAPGQTRAFLDRHYDFRGMGGYGNPVATDKELVFLSMESEDDTFELHNWNDKTYPPKKFTIAQMEQEGDLKAPDKLWTEWTGNRAKEKNTAYAKEFGEKEWPDQTWHEFLKGPYAYFRDVCPISRSRKTPPKALKALVWSDLPKGGVSSSSALTVAVALAMSAMNDYNMTVEDFIVAMGDIEWYRGTSGGYGDHVPIVRGKIDHFMTVGDRPLDMDAISYAPFPKDLRVVIMNSGITRDPNMVTNYQSGTTAGYAVAVMLLKHYFPQYADKLEENDPSEEPFKGLLREFLPGGTLEEIGEAGIYEVLKSLPQRISKDELLDIFEKDFAQAQRGEGDISLERAQRNLEQVHFLVGERGKIGVCPELPGGWVVRLEALFGLSGSARALKMKDFVAQGDFASIMEAVRASQRGAIPITLSRDGIVVVPSAVEARVRNSQLDILIDICRNPHKYSEEMHKRAELWRQSGAFLRGYDEALDIAGVVSDNFQDDEAATAMMGAGFGGLVLGLVKASQVEEFQQVMREQYYGEQGLEPEMYVLSTGQGASIMRGDFKAAARFTEAEAETTQIDDVSVRTAVDLSETSKAINRHKAFFDMRLNTNDIAFEATDISVLRISITHLSKEADDAIIEALRPIAHGLRNQGRILIIDYDYFDLSESERGHRLNAGIWSGELEEMRNIVAKTDVKSNFNIWTQQDYQALLAQPQEVAGKGIMCQDLIINSANVDQLVVLVDLMCSLAELKKDLRLLPVVWRRLELLGAQNLNNDTILELISDNVEVAFNAARWLMLRLPFAERVNFMNNYYREIMNEMYQRQI